IFFFSLLSLAVMVGFRLRELKSGKIPFPDAINFSRGFQVFSEWEKKAWDASRHFSMRFLSLFLRLAIIVIDKVRKAMRHAVSHMEEALVKKNANKDMQGASSVFLKDIAEHKKKIQARFNKEE
ncbi:MAG: hypothetical protein WCT48_01350, partial [Candidatus Paceibacterota bacterium]